VLIVAFAMLLILVLAGAVVAYVAFPHRGEQMPALPWLGDAMSRARRALPTQEQPEDFYESRGHDRSRRRG
jgi:hypothetical protein